MSGFTCGIHEPVAKKITEWRVIVSGVEIAHENIPCIRMLAHQTQLIKRPPPLPTAAAYGSGGAPRARSNLLATQIHPAAGITAIGARMPLVAFNCNLETSDVGIAKKIAKVIRGSSGGFRSCKAMGFMLEDRGIAQVSMNMVNYEDTPLYVTYEMIKALAERYGTRVIESEIVGLTPAKALIDCAEFYLKAKDFDCKNQVMEYHLIDMV